MNVIIRNIITPPGVIQSGKITLESVNVYGDGSEITYSFGLTPEQISYVSEEEASAVQIYDYAEKVVEFCDSMSTCTECPFNVHYTEDGFPHCRIGWPGLGPMSTPEMAAKVLSR